MTMKQILTFIFATVLLAACTSKEQQLRERASVLCQYLPDTDLQETSKAFMTADFYAVLDTLFHHLPEHEAMDHEWMHYFVTSNGSTIADYEVKEVKLVDETHATATIQVRQKWENGEFDENSDVEEHLLSMEKVNGLWLLSDFDGHKQDCIRHIAINRQEEALRQAMREYLVSEVGSHYLKGELCIPTLLIVAEEENEGETHVWCDTWVDWYQISADTLKTVSGGNHSGCMTLKQEGGKYVVTAFEQTEDGSAFQRSAERIFGEHLDVFQGMHSNQDIREAARKEQLGEYVRLHQLPVRYYQDYGWPAVELNK